jgi:hypothetical protein
MLMNGTPSVTTSIYSSGPAAGNAWFIVTGHNLGQGTVTFNGVPLAIQSQSAMSIVGRTPPGTPGPAVVVISNALGCQTTVPYTYL